MKLPNENPTPVTAAEIATALELIERATATFAYVERLTPKQRKAGLKIRRGAHQVIPQITSVARAFGVELPGATTDDLEAAMAHARELEPVLKAAAVLHATLRDDYFSAQGSAWRRAMALYGMLGNAAKANLNLGVALAPVTAWFRAGRAKRGAAGGPAADKPSEG